MVAGGQETFFVAIVFYRLRKNTPPTSQTSYSKQHCPGWLLTSLYFRTGQGMNSVALFLLRTAGGREDVAFWLLDALATAVIPGHWEQLSHIATAGVGVVTIRYECGSGSVLPSLVVMCGQSV